MNSTFHRLPDDVALHIISFIDDIDVRRAFGFKPRKLPKSDLNLKIQGSVVLHGNYRIQVGMYIIHKCPVTDRVTTYCKNKLVNTSQNSL